MRSLTWRQWLSRTLGLNRPAPPRPGARPCLEPLEVRCVPAFFPLQTPLTQFSAGLKAKVQVGNFIDEPRGNKKSTYTIKINWGDGTQTDTTSGVATFVQGSYHEFKVEGSHTYLRQRGLPPMQYTVTISVYAPVVGFV